MTQLTAIIDKIVAEFFPEEGSMGAAFGGCGDFADYCQSAAAEAGLSVAFESVYMTLTESECKFTAPIGVSLDDLEAIGVIGQLSHVWLVHEGRHFDALASEGVDNPFELRLFRQVCVEVMTEKCPDRLAALALEHAWWRESIKLTQEFLSWHEQRKAE